MNLTGPCCCCGTMYKVRTLVMLEKKAPVPGTGWGCVQCGLPLDGALAVLCDQCAANSADLPNCLRFVCRGYPTLGERTPIEEVAGEHAHDMSQHPEVLLPSKPETYGPLAAARHAAGDGTRLAEPNARACVHCGNPVGADQFCPDCNRYVCIACAWDYGHHSGGRHGR